MHTRNHGPGVEVAQAGGGGDFGGFDSGSSSGGDSFSGSGSFSGGDSSIGYDSGATTEGSLGEALTFGAGVLGLIVLIASFWAC
jgi:hypothetical protein